MRVLLSTLLTVFLFSIPGRCDESGLEIFDKLKSPIILLSGCVGFGDVCGVVLGSLLSITEYVGNTCGNTFCPVSNVGLLCTPGCLNFSGTSLV